MHGIVSASIIQEGILRTLTDSLRVVPRTWRWNESHWTFTEGAGQPCGTITERYQLDGPLESIQLALNTRIGSCTAGSIEPVVIDTVVDIESALRLDSIGSGPNSGLWYADSAFYRMERGSVMNGSIAQTGQSYLVTHADDRTVCRQPLKLKPSDPVVVSFYTYNQVCRGVNLAPFYAAIWSHEGFGTQDAQDSTRANGHEARRWIAARTENGDPYFVVESLVTVDRNRYRNLVRTRLWGVELRINDMAGDHGFVRDNGWCSSLYIWNVVLQKYVLTPIRQGEDTCI